MEAESLNIWVASGSMFIAHPHSLIGIVDYTKNGKWESIFFPCYNPQKKAEEGRKKNKKELQI